MSRLILIFLLIAGLVAAVSLIASAFGRPAKAELPVPMQRTSALQKVSFTLLIAVMCGVATGWLGAD